ncbi:MAG: hypothetical protein OEW12_01505 [Deltaproteobacteria bacterium]|nr:hypothetical protein [Deltaproteobacteria bacterium]
MVKRLIFYLVTGGLLLMWISPPSGMLRVGAVILVILLAVLAESRLGPAMPGKGGRRSPDGKGHPRPPGHSEPGGVAGRFSFSLKGQSAPKSGKREKRVLRRVYTTDSRQEADDVVEGLRKGRVNPVLVSGKSPEPSGGVLFDVLVVEKEFPQAMDLINRMENKKVQKPS